MADLSDYDWENQYDSGDDWDHRDVAPTKPVAKVSTTKPTIKPTTKPAAAPVVDQYNPADWAPQTHKAAKTTGWDSDGWGSTNFLSKEQQAENERLDRERKERQAEIANDEALLLDQYRKYSNELDANGEVSISFTPVKGFFENMIVPGDKLLVERYTPMPKDRSLFSLYKTEGIVSKINLINKKDEITGASVLDTKSSKLYIDFQTKSGSKQFIYNFEDILKASTTPLPKETKDHQLISNTLKINKIISNRHLRKPVAQVQPSVPTPPPAPKTKSLSETQQKYKDALQVGQKIKVQRYVPAAKDSTDVKVIDSFGVVVSKTDSGFTASYSLPNGTTRDLTFTYSAIVDDSEKLPKISPTKNDQFNKVKIIRYGITGGNELADPYYLKYLKYKAKYLKLKESL